jgi:hypothetical protein
MAEKKPTNAAFLSLPESPRVLRRLEFLRE